MAQKTFRTQYLRDELGLPHDNSELVVSDEIVDHGRWSILHSMIFKDPADNKYYEIGYRTGATELQDERPWEYEDTVTATEVEKRTLLQEVYVDVDDTTKRDISDYLNHAADVLCEVTYPRETVYGLLQRIFLDYQGIARTTNTQQTIREEVAAPAEQLAAELEHAENVPDNIPVEAQEDVLAAEPVVQADLAAFHKFYQKLKKKMDDIFYLDSETTMTRLSDTPQLSDSFVVHCEDGTDLTYQLSNLYASYLERKERGTDKPIKSIAEDIESAYDLHDLQRDSMER